MIKVGLIGYGFSGATFHAPLLEVLENFEITKVLSSNPEKVHQDLGNVEVVSDLQPILDDSSIQLVVITTPNLLHFEMAKQSLLAGKHVVLEKPMVNTVEEAEQLLEVAKERNVMLSVYQNRRWDNDFLTVKHLITEGVLGEIRTYEAHFDRYRPDVQARWREQEGVGSGILYDLGSHLIDQALHLFGPPQFVQADLLHQRDQAVTDDYFHVVLGYDTLRVILHAGSVVPAHDLKYIVHGEKGSFIKYGLDCQEEALKAGKKPNSSDWGEDDPAKYGELTIEKEGRSETQRVKTIPGSYLTYYQKVYEHIKEGKASPVTAEEGLLTIKLIELAKLSSEQKKAIYLSE
ncbi:oxidoreductase [Shimazuella sp. AN120528]|uniref:oxidoreductase n=1 Tax=Shimazuella soli TaxID=1892854 RepID=UPI001F10FF8D|nr:oxidoreductase [Shimazuella soli]MCH5585766.1 oxidoreductase [Shimazuella soli]